MRRDPHVILPLLALVLASVCIYAFSLDYRLADTYYGLEGGEWRLRQAWLTSVVLHEYGQRFSTLWGVMLLAVSALSCFWNPLKPFRRGLLATVAAVITSLLLVSFSKHMLPLPCPWDLQRYGGALISDAVYRFHPGEVGGCFPSGHATGGFCLFALYFFARQYRLPRYHLLLLPGLFIGLLYGIDQQLRGAHFLSHDLVSAALCWFVSYFVFRAFFAARSVRTFGAQKRPHGRSVARVRMARIAGGGAVPSPRHW